jgi:tetratricopeptide (TPR) repeat protein
LLRLWATFWVDCSSGTSARADFKSIGSLCGWDADDTDFLCGVKDQLASLEEQSLLILDNCDDPKTNFGLYIPNSPQVSVVLTTRLSNASKYASPVPQNIGVKLYFQMDGLDPASAVKLILEASEVHDRSEDTLRQAEKIANALDYHPLAIVVASSLVQSTAYSLAGYAEALKDRFTQKELMNTESEQTTYRKVSTTFEMSTSALHRLAAADPTARDALELLSIVAFMHHQGVSEDMFVRAWEYEDKVLSSRHQKHPSACSLTLWHAAQSRKYFSRGTTKERVRAFLKARAHLIRLTLMKHDATNNTVYMHSLIHFWARERLHHAIRPWAGAASILALAAQGSQGRQPYSPQLSIHCETNFRLKQAAESTTLQGEALCRIWCNFAWQMVHGHHALAIDVVECLARKVQPLAHLDAENPLVTESQHLRAVLAERDGDVPQAVALLEGVVKIRAKLGEDHPELLASQYDLGKAYLTAGNLPRAVETFEHVVLTEEKTLAEDHPSRLISQHALAAAYMESGQISEAIEIFEHVVHMEAKTVPEDHPERLASQSELAHAYLEDGRASPAIEIFEHVLRMREELAEDHSERLMSQHNLARAYLEEGSTAHAIEIFERIVCVEEKKLPEDNPQRLATQHELASAYLEDDRVSEAIEIFEHVVRIKRRLAESHPRRLLSQHELARAYWRDRRLAEAELLMGHVVAVERRTLSEDHPERVASERFLAMIREDEQDSLADLSNRHAAA